MAASPPNPDDVATAVSVGEWIHSWVLILVGVIGGIFGGIGSTLGLTWRVSGKWTRTTMSADANTDEIARHAVRIAQLELAREAAALKIEGLMAMRREMEQLASQVRDGFQQVNMRLDTALSHRRGE